MTDISPFIKINSPSITKTYRRGSGQGVTSDTINLQNTSAGDIVATFQGMSGISFSPSSVVIPANGSTSVQVQYDVSKFESLSDGTNTVNNIISLAAQGVTTVLPPVSQPPQQANFALGIRAVAGPINMNNVTGGTLGLTANANSDTNNAVVTFEAYAFDSTSIPQTTRFLTAGEGQNVQWFVTGGSFNNTPVGTGTSVSITFPNLPQNYNVTNVYSVPGQNLSNTLTITVLPVSTIHVTTAPPVIPPITPPILSPVSIAPVTATIPPITPPIINPIPKIGSLVAPSAQDQTANTPDLQPNVLYTVTPTTSVPPSSPISVTDQSIVSPEPQPATGNPPNTITINGQVFTYLNGTLYPGNLF